MESAALRLGRRYKSLLITSVYALTTPIRFRPKLIPTLKPYLSRGNTGSERQVAQWVATGGSLINYRALFERPEHDAHLICEAPTTLDWLNTLIERTRTIAVIYRPPTWTLHMKECDRIGPPVDWCRMFVDLVRDGRLDNRQVGILDTLGIDMTSAGCFTDRFLMDQLGINMRELSSVRRLSLRGIASKAYLGVIPLILRVPPQGTHLRPLYEHLKTMPRHGDLHLVQGRILSKFTKGWRDRLRQLSHCGSIEMHPRLGFYWENLIAPNYARIGKIHERTRADMEAVTAYVDSLPELPAHRLPRRVRLPSPRPLDARAPRAGAAHFPDSPR